MVADALYEYKGQRISVDNIVRGLKKVGVNDGDIIFVHSDISVFGKLLVFNRTFLLESIVSALQKAVGLKGAVILPTFSYSFCNDHP